MLGNRSNAKTELKNLIGLGPHTTLYLRTRIRGMRKFAIPCSSAQIKMRILVETFFYLSFHSDFFTNILTLHIKTFLFARRVPILEKILINISHDYERPLVNFPKNLTLHVGGGGPVAICLQNYCKVSNVFMVLL